MPPISHPLIFNGRKFAEEVTQELVGKISQLDRPLKIAVLVDEQNESATRYTQLKERLAGRLRVVFSRIDSLNEAGDADGILVQLPYPNSKQLIDKIPQAKDVDGLRSDNLFKPAVVRAILEILKFAVVQGLLSGQVMVVGSQGFVGSRLVAELNCQGMDEGDFNADKLKQADTIISCTGQANLITADMVKPGAILIDVGAPQAEFTAQALAKSAFYTPVPGGVGPVTVAMLFKNLYESRVGLWGAVDK
ncbi:MAG: bifunctional 5,10-methylenetetrahydrofolate dehydrogenase/5,10-methenyltetrahydrofolate cyclohydrolase [bacterium]|nr:bifunctional 5,10-methylenetetrahydrofolate dehydrogenase/5,10-methenyltetrahydrofolate cyclohydrolase [bacterium]